jgi:hypothetical protein
MKIETKTKRRIYIFLSIILGILLGVIAYALVEQARINQLLLHGLTPDYTNRSFFLPPSVAVIFLIAGALLGYVVGVRWWQIVYVERRHWRFRKQQINN